MRSAPDETESLVALFGLERAAELQALEFIRSSSVTIDAARDRFDERARTARPKSRGTAREQRRKAD